MSQKPRAAAAPRPSAGKNAARPLLSVSLVGVGAMGSALGRGLIQAGALGADELTFFDPDDRAAKAFEKATGARRVPTLSWALGSSITIFAVKPQMLPTLLEQCRASTAEGSTWVSVAAGVPIEKLKEHSGHAAWVRAMPNLASAHGRGTTGLVKAEAVKSDQFALVLSLFEAVGTAVVVDESKMDAVTALAGSGPALVLGVLDALAQGGVWAGLSYADALALACGAADGALALLKHENAHPAQLQSRVASPGGTTIAALATMEKQAVAGALMQAVKAAADRSKELSG